MRAPIVLGIAIGCGVLIATDHAFPKNGRSWVSEDPDLIALENLKKTLSLRTVDLELMQLEKLSVRAKEAMDAFVLRPRVADAYETICLGCTGEVAGTPLVRFRRSLVSNASNEDITAGVVARRIKKPEYASIAPRRHAKRTTTLRQRLARRMHRLKRTVRRFVMPRSAEIWDAELRR